MRQGCSVVIFRKHFALLSDNAQHDSRSKCPRSGNTTHFCRPVVSHVRSIQSIRVTVHSRWRIPILNQPLSERGRLSICKNSWLPHATPIAFLVAYGELAIGLALITGVLVRSASICGAIYMVTLLFSANYPGPHAALWQYFGASLEHLVLALCFSAFVLGDSAQVLSLRSYLRRCPGTAKATDSPE
jgi:hypothetical protein